MDRTQAVVIAIRNPRPKPRALAGKRNLSDSFQSSMRAGKHEDSDNTMA